MINGWGADWPDGFGFLSPDRRQPGHPRRRRQHEPVGVKDPEVDTLIDKALTTDDDAARAQGDLGRHRQEGHGATPCILPGVWAKGLLYRPPTPDERVRQRRLPACTTTSRMGRREVAEPGSDHDPEGR